MSLVSLSLPGRVHMCMCMCMYVHELRAGWRAIPCALSPVLIHSLSRMVELSCPEPTVECVRTNLKP